MGPNLLWSDQSMSPMDVFANQTKVTFVMTMIVVNYPRLFSDEEAASWNFSDEDCIADNAEEDDSNVAEKEGAAAVATAPIPLTTSAHRMRRLSQMSNTNLRNAKKIVTEANEESDKALFRSYSVRFRKSKIVDTIVQLPEESSTAVVAEETSKESVDKPAQTGVPVIDFSDTDQMTADEFQAFFTDMLGCVGYRNPTPEVVQEVLRSLDANGDGKITWDEFRAWWLEKGLPPWSSFIELKERDTFVSHRRSRVPPRCPLPPAPTP
eukprot:TRINITY_DN6472_c0_g1_i2.p1 TRINITY_DN6472_c0_g1~~TRINITY_DN6472_c0_g1_i2.p1  ORF type:complete len:266 (-),score=56.05 TRINITY_DN6472_c0_g1_i2:60-857(-)